MGDDVVVGGVEVGPFELKRVGSPVCIVGGWWSSQGGGHVLCNW